MLYFFILGNNPTLSIAEIWRIFAHKVRIKQISDEVLILETKEKIDCHQSQRQLGGTVKIGEIVGTTDVNLSTDITNQILELLPKKFKKIYFGFSLYKLEDFIGLKKFVSEIKRLGMEVKRGLREKGLRARWVVSRNRILSSVVVEKNKLLKQGVEIVFLIGKQEIYLGITRAVQEFEEYGWRDWQRPQKRIKEGMLPPKLAKIMINLALPSGDSTILDPFCGSGTILQEAILLGYKNVIGADINKEAVEASKANIKWLKVNFPIKIFPSDVRKLAGKLPANSIDIIISEPYLGPIKFKIQGLIGELSELYLAAFREFKKILKKGGRVVIIFPIFKVGHSVSDIPILDEIKRMGYKVEIPISEELRTSSVIKVTPRGSIIYSRPDQKILREIFVFKS